MSTGFLGCLAGAILMGMSCGTGCSPAISIFLGSYIFHAEGETRQSLAAFLKFFVGKAAAVVGVCAGASLLGTALLGENGYFGKYSLRYLMPGFLILTGIYMSVKCIRELRHSGCESCGGHCHTAVPAGLRNASPLIGGFLYGLTPCAPLVLLAGYAVTLRTAPALVLGAVFSAACMVSPLFLMLALLKLAAVKMKSEVPSFFRAARLVMSALVLVLGVVTCFTGIEPGV